MAKGKARGNKRGNKRDRDGSFIKVVIYTLVAAVVTGFLMLYHSHHAIAPRQHGTQTEMGIHIVGALVDHPDGVNEREMQRIHELLVQSDNRAANMWMSTAYAGEEMKLVCNALDEVQRQLVAKASQLQYRAQALDIDARENRGSVFQHMDLWAEVRDMLEDAVLIGLKNDANPIAQLAVATMKADMLNHNRGVIRAFELGEFAIKLAKKFKWHEAVAKPNGQLQAYFSLVVNQAHTCDHVRKMCHILQESGGAAFSVVGKSDHELKDKCDTVDYHELGKSLASSVLDHAKFVGMQEDFKRSVRQLAGNVLTEKCTEQSETATEEELLADVFGGNTQLVK